MTSASRFHLPRRASAAEALMPEEKGGVRLRTLKTSPAPFPASEATCRSDGLVSPRKGEGGLREYEPVRGYLGGESDKSRATAVSLSPQRLRSAPTPTPDVVPTAAKERAPHLGGELRCSGSICRRLGVSLEDLSARYRSATRLPRPARVISGVVSAARRPPHSAQRLTRTAAPYKRRDGGRGLERP